MNHYPRPVYERLVQVGDHPPELAGVGSVAPFFSGTAFAVGEIKVSLEQIAGAFMMLKQGNEVGSAVQQKLAAEQISKAACQMKSLADMLARVSINHINGRPRP